jgi:hypothetical protein
MLDQTRDRGTVLQERLDREAGVARAAVAETFGEGELPVVGELEPAAGCCPLFELGDAAGRGRVSRSCPSW